MPHRPFLSEPRFLGLNDTYRLLSWLSFNLFNRGSDINISPQSPYKTGQNPNTYLPIAIIQGQLWF